MTGKRKTIKDRYMEKLILLDYKRKQKLVPCPQWLVDINDMTNFIAGLDLTGEIDVVSDFPEYEAIYERTNEYMLCLVNKHFGVSETNWGSSAFRNVTSGISMVKTLLPMMKF
jgi:hypothetical protein